MGSTTFHEGDWWAHFGAHAVRTGGIEVGWLGGEPAGARLAVRAFLKAELARIRAKGAQAEEASVLGLLSARKPRSGDDVTQVLEEGPFVEFGVGEYPSAPEAWPLVALDDLVAGAVALLSTTG